MVHNTLLDPSYRNGAKPAPKSHSTPPGAKLQLPNQSKPAPSRTIGSEMDEFCPTNIPTNYTAKTKPSYSKKPKRPSRNPIFTPCR
ncbi:hypothetical protein Nepgr_006743 [Nepenthes gracilis]|uniref:Uncharacterized protein n=1 Tax=Nepenthes gracilis TaxID=150966 RepID=A0AAD3XHM9_NEPGR|nr:hypothetical protein Nepgr_006743 [Nepenthes gracilis]